MVLKDYKEYKDCLEKFGFNFGIGGAHIARTMMYDELEHLLSSVDYGTATKDDYKIAIEEDNCLGKVSGKSRKLSYLHLVSLYSLDRDVLLFRSMLYLWGRDAISRPLLSLLCSYCRDAVLRESAQVIFDTPEGSLLPREEMESFFEKKFPSRFSPATLKSVAQNVNGTWTKAGFLKGRIKKIRSKPNVTAGAMTYALLLAYVNGYRGINLFSSEYVKLLDCTRDRSMELAEEASRRGWLVYKNVGDVVEVLFPKLLTAEEQELVREQA